MPEMPMEEGSEGMSEGSESSLPGQLMKFGENLKELVSAVGQSGAPEGVRQAAGDLMSAFEAFASAVSGGGEAKAVGATTPEQGGASGAVPYSPVQRG